MPKKIRVPIEELKKDLLSSMLLKEVAAKHKISSSWASLLRTRLGAYKRLPRNCPYCHRSLSCG